MQQPVPMFPVMPSFPPANITTEQIQKYLDENKKLILAILDNQNLGKLSECAQYQAQLQKNLMYLAAIADAQPQTPTVPTQLTPHPGMQQGGGFYFQPQQPGIFPSKAAAPFASPHPFQDPQQMHSNQGQLPFRSSQNDVNPGGNSIPSSAGGANRRDKPDNNTTAATSDAGKDK